MKQNYAESLLGHLVGINSQTGQETGIREVQMSLARELVTFDFEIEYVRNPHDFQNQLLVARKMVSSDFKTICFIGHSDVVTSPSQVPFEIKSDVIKGAGVGDNKGGLVVGLEAIREYLVSKDQLVNIIFVVSPSEETGSIGFHSIFNEISKQCDYVFGLEPALSCGSVISSRSGNRWYNIHSKGISAHSGRFGQSYINAAHQLSILINDLHEENNELLGRRVNVGSLKSSMSGYNTICPQAEAKLDTRFSTFKSREHIHKKIEEKIEKAILTCSMTGKKGQFFYSIEDDCPPMEKVCESSINSYLEQLSLIEKREVFHKHSGGAADINYFTAGGAVLIDGLGPVAGGLHTKNEYIERDSLEKRIKALSHFIINIGLEHRERSSYGISQSA